MGQLGCRPYGTPACSGQIPGAPVPGYRLYRRFATGNLSPATQQGFHRGVPYLEEHSGGGQHLSGGIPGNCSSGSHTLGPARHGENPKPLKRGSGVNGGTTTPPNQRRVCWGPRTRGRGEKLRDQMVADGCRHELFSAEECTSSQMTLGEEKGKLKRLMVLGKRRSAKSFSHRAPGRIGKRSLTTLAIGN